ncbi:MAG: HTTM domain-containing protein [Flavobacteriaceae bacterium]|nr:HTTM domain-containing protein [Flavobacteriaceae bacterium]
MTKKSDPSEKQTPQRFNKLLNFVRSLFQPTDVSSLVVFRIAFGMTMFVEVFRYFKYDWIANYWIKPTVNLPYYPFLWLDPLPGDGMYYLFAILGLLALFIASGFLYRISTILFFFGFTYSYLLEQTRYLNHFYLVILLAFIFIFLPANKTFSLDNLLFKRKSTQTQPLWSLWMMRLMIGIPLFYGGIAKINMDWFQAMPLKIWLRGNTDLPVVGPYMDTTWMAYTISYIGLIFDLVVVPLLIYKRTRWFAVILSLVFHLSNSQLFTIGIFPWFMLLGTTVYFEPDWPRRLINYFSSNKNIISIPKIENLKPNFKLSSRQKALSIGLAIWFVIMNLLPFRHLLFDGNPNWNEQGHKYAWHMKLRTKRAKGYLLVKDVNGTFEHIIEAKDYMPRWQARKAIARPGILWTFVKRLEEEYKAKGFEVAIYANIEATLNGRPYQQFTNPDVDLTKVPHPYWGELKWVVPLTTPLN